MRITRKVFTDLAIFMMGLGLCMGLIFPGFMVLLGIPKTYVLTVSFFMSCIIAGVVVGAVNILLARSIVGKRIYELSKKMRFIANKLTSAKSLLELQECDSDECRLIVDSDDELGEGALAYNTLLTSLSHAISTETALRSFNSLLSSQLELEMITKLAVDNMLDYIEAPAGCVIIERGGEFFIPYSHGVKEAIGILENRNLLQLFESKKAQSMSLDLGIKIDGLLLEFYPKEVYISPLLYKDIPIGMLIIAAKNSIEEHKKQTLELFNQSFAIALNNAITYDQLQKLAANDPLTGLYNRRFGMSRFSEEFMRSIRTHTPIGLLIFDIDHFKRVNDTYGHTIGDRVLINLAKISSMAARKGDIIIRHGGEEFMIVLPGADKKDCLYIAERLRHMVEESLVPIGDAQVRVTISIGAISYPEFSCENELELMKVADQALYAAKDKGRNIVVSY